MFDPVSSKSQFASWEGKKKIKKWGHNSKNQTWNGTKNFWLTCHYIQTETCEITKFLRVEFLRVDSMFFSPVDFHANALRNGKASCVTSDVLLPITWSRLGPRFINHFLDFFLTRASKPLHHSCHRQKLAADDRKKKKKGGKFGQPADNAPQWCTANKKDMPTS